MFQRGLLRGDGKREHPPLRTARHIHAAVDDRDLLHERRLPTLRQIPVDPGSVEELADAYANDRFLVDGVSEANSRLEILFVRWRKPCRQPVVECVKS